MTNFENFDFFDSIVNFFWSRIEKENQFFWLFFESDEFSKILEKKLNFDEAGFFEIRSILENALRNLWTVPVGPNH